MATSNSTIVNARERAKRRKGWTFLDVISVVSKLQESGGPNQSGVAPTLWDRPGDQGPKGLRRSQNVVICSFGNDRSLEREPQLEGIYAFVSRHAPQVRSSQYLLRGKRARQVTRGIRRMNTQWHDFGNNLIRKRDVTRRLALFHSRTGDRADAGEDMVCKGPIQVIFGSRQQIDDLVTVGEQPAKHGRWNVLLLCRAAIDSHSPY